MRHSRQHRLTVDGAPSVMAQNTGFEYADDLFTQSAKRHLSKACLTATTSVGFYEFIGRLLYLTTTSMSFAKIVSIICSH
jgi:hypothetical protein